MPTVTITFALPEEQVEFQAIDGTRLRSVLWDLDQYLQNKIKVGRGT